MSVFNSLERKFGYLAFPSIIRYYALMHVLVYVLQIIRPNISDTLDFDRAKVFAGEYWRVFTCFFAASEFGGFGFISLLFLICMINFMFMVNDGLEEEWGAFKTSLFCYFGMACVIIGNLVLPSTQYSGLMVYSSAFLAFATLYPKVEVRLFMVIPVQVGFLGILQAVIMLLTCLTSPILFPFYLIATANYFLWTGIPALRGKAQQAKSAHRRSRFQSTATRGDEAFHTCVICDRTDSSHPELDFRIGEDGQERCSDHLAD